MAYVLSGPGIVIGPSSGLDEHRDEHNVTGFGKPPVPLVLYWLAVHKPNVMSGRKRKCMIGVLRFFGPVASASPNEDHIACVRQVAPRPFMQYS